MGGKDSLADKQQCAHLWPVRGALTLANKNNIGECAPRGPAHRPRSLLAVQALPSGTRSFFAHYQLQRSLALILTSKQFKLNLSRVSNSSQGACVLDRRHHHWPQIGRIKERDKQEEEEDR